jgi:hypothetical protein
MSSSEKGKVDYVQWDSVSKYNANADDAGSAKKVDFLKLTSGGTYRIRPIYQPVRFWKYFNKKGDRLRTAICSDADTCSIRDRYPDLKKPSLRYAAVVIDRADGKVKIIEAPKMVFSPLGNHMDVTGKNPGSSKDGYDFQIKVVGKGLNTRYEVTPINNTPLTADEMKLIQATIGGDVKTVLADMFRVDTPEQIEKKLFGEIESSGATEDPGNGDAPADEPYEAAPGDQQPVNW